MKKSPLQAKTMFTKIPRIVFLGGQLYNNGETRFLKIDIEKPKSNESSQFIKV